ncbi:MAG: hypothetical protein GTO20_23645 [Candidatus Aminicenantes bacterium]|nr:hypothetical protein [Candidatus Aminicenantes bacterium]
MAALFFLADFLGDLLIPNFGIGFSGIVFPGGSKFPGQVLLTISSLGIILAAFLPFHPSRQRIKRKMKYVFSLVRLSIFGFILFLCVKTFTFYLFFFNGLIDSLFPVPFSLAAAFVLGMNLWRMQKEWKRSKPLDNENSPRRLIIVHGISFVILVFLVPLFLILFHGTTYYPHNIGWGKEFEPVDCIIVFGAKVNKDGIPSQALSDRVRQGVSLFREGKGQRLVMSGGYNSHNDSESWGMKNMAVSLGVPQRMIIMDKEGYRTYKTVFNVKGIMEKQGWQRSLSVSQYYHLLRIKLAAHRVGLNTDTVPTWISMDFHIEPRSLVREIAALYYYYFFKWGKPVPQYHKEHSITRIKASLDK